MKSTILESFPVVAVIMLPEQTILSLQMDTQDNSAVSTPCRSKSTSPLRKSQRMACEAWVLWSPHWRTAKVFKLTQMQCAFAWVKIHASRRSHLNKRQIRLAKTNLLIFMTTDIAMYLASDREGNLTITTPNAPKEYSSLCGKAHVLRP